ncbi:hypothetical protein C440_04478 [Haloferax mucosum ATCC BAA-1512]|uniref:Uncharacterized protein n=1 Tax=Haloferax mucosum ATCC BAA-1512 TaxID=662479 RepID=M0IMF0_9EURY|nr:hypothetical protein [Haloferax mucosum]ELZ97003.1 hypothetical protein C440_04478 [Haloferax mucosum ATCC BAA-1512]
MNGATIDNIETLLEGVLEETEDSEVHFKIRTALQFLSALRVQHQDDLEIVEDDEEIETDVFENLREMGYIE